MTGVAALVSFFMTSAVSAQAADPRVQDLVVAGKVRAGIGLTPLALTKDPATGDMRGVALDLGRALAARIGVELHPVIYPRPGAVIEGLKAKEWDVAISLGVDPNRAAEVDFSPPYMEVDLTGLVPAGSAIARIADADRAGVRIAVPRVDLVDLVLSRQFKQAELVRADTVIGAFELLRAGQADVSALPRPNLLQYTSQLAGSRVLSDRFGVNSVAIAVPKGNAGRLAYIREFIEEAKSSGLVQRAIENAGLRGVQVAPMAAN
jgi:polar amino acid transport system substrate-binding protein